MEPEPIQVFKQVARRMNMNRDDDDDHHHDAQTAAVLVVRLILICSCKKTQAYRSYLTLTG